MADLTTLANAQGWCNSTDSVLLPRLISALSASIENWLGYNVISASYTQTLDGDGRTRLYLPQIPITAVSSLIVGLTTIQPSPAFGQGGYVIDGNCRFPGAPLNSGLSISLRPGSFGFSGMGGPNYFWEGKQNVFISYTAGFPLVPPDLEQACLYWLKIAFADSAPGINPVLSALKAGATTFTYAGRSQVSDPRMIPIPPVVLAMLIPYKLTFQTV
jgi:hypothetical protein